MIAFRNYRPYSTIPVGNIIIACGVSLFLFLLFRQYPIIGENPVLTRLGGYSLEIYILHTYFVTAGRAAFAHRGWNEYGVVSLIFILGVAGPLVIAWLLKNIKIFKKLELYHILFRPYYFVIRKTGDIKK